MFPFVFLFVFLLLALIAFISEGTKTSNDASYALRFGHMLGAFLGSINVPYVKVIWTFWYDFGTL